MCLLSSVLDARIDDLPSYFVEELLVSPLANTNVVCADFELLHFNPPSGQTCAAYMSTFISQAGGYLTNPNATTDCNFCDLSQTNDFLAINSTSHSNRWRDFGILWAYIIFNACGALFFYWLARVPQAQKDSKVETAVRGLCCHCL
jgi:ATP-binding cassette subfamily G (WHITE) protein 2 (PDR)